jgi:hypothetical protein
MTAIEELKSWKEELEKEPQYFENVESGDDPIKLPKNPTTEQLLKALRETRSVVALALDEIHAELVANKKDLDKLRNHRHDFSKTFSGRAEF